MKHRTLTNTAEIEEIIRKCQACHVAMTGGDGKPYLVTMNFGYRDGTVYLHSSQAGRKIDILKNHPEVCIGFSTDYELRSQSADVACSYSMKYRSVVISGKVEFISDEPGKIRALDIVMSNYSPRKFLYNPPSLKEVCCWKVKAEKIECRVYGY